MTTACFGVISSSAKAATPPVPTLILHGAYEFENQKYSLP